MNSVEDYARQLVKRWKEEDFDTRSEWVKNEVADANYNTKSQWIYKHSLYTNL
jgi:hypothetical protein